jgi:hypothetical protein
MADKPPARLPAGREMLLEFDGGNRRHARLASLVHAFDVWNQVELAERPGVSAVRLRTAGGEALGGYAAFRRLVRSLRLLWPVALLTFVPGAAALGRRWFPDPAAASEAAPTPGDTPENHSGVSPPVPLPPAG